MHRFSRLLVFRYSGDSGITLMELVVAIVISSLIAGTFATIFYNVTTSELKDATRDELDIIAESLLDFYKDLDQFPKDSGAVSTDFLDLERTPTPNSRMDAAVAALQAWRVAAWDGPYIQDKFDDDSYQKDAWQNDYIYDYTYGNDFCVVTSYGPDGVVGGTDNIVVRANAKTIKEDRVRGVQDELDIIQLALADYVRATGSAPSDISSLFEWEVLNLHMDESVWTGAADEVVDNSGMGNNGTAYNGVTTTSSGKVGRAGSFDGSSDYASIADSVSLDIDGAITIEAWVKLTAGYPSSHQMIASKGGVAWYMSIYNNKVFFSPWINGTQTYTQGSEIVSENAWHHVACSWSPATDKYYTYLDGQVDVDVTHSGSSLSTNASNLLISAYASQGDLPFNGIIDEVRIYSVTLSSDEIYQHYINPGYPRDYFDLHDYAFKYDGWESEYALGSMTVGGETVYYFYSCGSDRADDSGADDDIKPRGL
ncbi:MAG: LamG-like jellyroll fold domain-containing protein [Candidatus Kaelpia imicola]|nr:LamG-like jellyroll fold domain-containing protein [Candidatus Kaelpia imicola]